MSKNKTTQPSEADTVEPTPAPQPAPAVIVAVRVLRNGLLIAGGVAAKGATVRVTEESATFHEKRGEVTVLGTV